MNLRDVSFREAAAIDSCESRLRPKSAFPLADI
jgi:hypothetical protein